MPPNPLYLLLPGLLLSAGCAQPAVRLVVRSSAAETVSLVGDTLYAPPLDPAGGPARIGRLHAARAGLGSDSSDLGAWLRLARSTAAVGRLREAVDIYTRAAGVPRSDPRLFRERGELLLRLRYLDAAIADFRKAGLLAIGRGTILLVEPVETDSGSNSITVASLQFETFFYLGVALYCKGDNPAAYTVLAEAAKAAVTTEALSRALLWTFFAVRRVGDGSEGKFVLDLVHPEWAETLQSAELDLLLGFKGVLPTDTIRARALRAKGLERGLYSYGLAYFLQHQRDRRADAELWLERARSGDWTTLPYLAAEADLARLRGLPLKPR